MKPSGFTLLEVMVALFIMAVVIMAVFKLNAQTFFIHRNVRFESVAPFLAQSKIEETALKPLAEINDQDGDFGDKWPSYSWQMRVSDFSIESLGEVAERMKQIDVTVSDGNDENAYRLRTYRFFNE